MNSFTWQVKLMGSSLQQWIFSQFSALLCESDWCKCRSSIESTSSRLLCEEANCKLFTYLSSITPKHQANLLFHFGFHLVMDSCRIWFNWDSRCSHNNSPNAGPVQISRLGEMISSQASNLSSGSILKITMAFRNVTAYEY